MCCGAFFRFIVDGASAHVSLYPLSNGFWATDTLCIPIVAKLDKHRLAEADQ